VTIPASITFSVEGWFAESTSVSFVALEYQPKLSWSAKVYSVEWHWLKLLFHHPFKSWATAAFLNAYQFRAFHLNQHQDCCELRNVHSLELGRLRLRFLHRLKPWLMNALVSADHFHPLNSSQNRNCCELKVSIPWNWTGWDHCSCIDWSLGWILLCLMQISFSCYVQISVDIIPNSFMHWSLRLVILCSVQTIFIHNTRLIEIVILISVADVIHEWFVQFGVVWSVTLDSGSRLLRNKFAFRELCWFRSFSLPESATEVGYVLHSANHFHWLHLNQIKIVANWEMEIPESLIDWDCYFISIEVLSRECLGGWGSGSSLKF
jgi:hypothetical protein